MKNALFSIAVSLLPLPTLAGPASPYVGQEAREIKALSPQEVDDYLNGKGMGYAKAAELNHYPGPRHVLDAAKELALTEGQTKRTQALYDAMKQQAIALGRQLVEKEKDLDRRFANGAIDSDTLNTLLADIGALQAKIRYVHLQAHLDQKAILTAHQTHRYDQLRGYGDHNGGAHQHAH